MSDMKVCSACAEIKPKDQFWKGQCYCVPCHKTKQKERWNSRAPHKRLEQHLKYKYGVTHAQFIKRWDEQKGLCAICADQLPDLMTYDNRRRGYAIDHNHKTGEFRGILCTHCNSLLGMAKDSGAVLQSAIEYLNNNGSYADNVVGLDNMRAARKGRSA